jgi:hypothetical protein
MSVPGIPHPNEMECPLLQLSSQFLDDRHFCDLGSCTPYPRFLLLMKLDSQDQSYLPYLAYSMFLCLCTLWNRWNQTDDDDDDDDDLKLLSIVGDG